LKTDRVNVRAGPTKDHEVTFVFTRAGLPVEIIGEFENWRRIRDWEGGEGWVYHSLLSGKRNVVVSSKSKSEHELIAVHESADAKSDVTARLQPGVLGQIKRCQANFCRVMGLGFDGWVAQERLWGVYPNESVD
ncbi:MAG TPA: SH3 domain-containing protein, partial [Aestuariivirgaceae bacterium]|nr:SH3 domain-containing protein [Aestuariivirgaceae bacterium]